ncbi:hypothetical protein PCASD_26922 [Puccinia coronata f. sp. avenae]|uniref:Uncharacterized protein n=1 Tax=Puccinia coronata f. sp. avenae TaxID=200324 RepID=A0A2N5RUX5_9BASI|nr:hypothetical protein PCASD_26922 [Puccinia coronata f. sp. avenae]
MEGYDDRDWKTLRKSMLDVWGGSPLKIRYTIQDLYDLIKLCQDKGGIKDIKDFRIYQSKFMMITNTWSETNTYPPRPVYHTYFSWHSHENIKGRYGSSGGRSSSPIYKRFKAGSNFAAANKEMQKNLDLKKGDGKKREKMLEEYPKEPVQSQIESMAKAIEALASKLNAPAKAEYHAEMKHHRDVSMSHDPALTVIVKVIIQHIVMKLRRMNEKD